MSSSAAELTWDLAALDGGRGFDGLRADLDDALTAFRDRLPAPAATAGLDRAELAAVLRAYGAVHEAMLRLRAWAGLRVAADVEDAGALATARATDGVIREAVRELAAFDQQLVALSDDALGRHLDDPSLAFCRRYVERLRARPAPLSDEAEAVLASVAAADRARWVRLHETTLARLRAPVLGRDTDLFGALDLCRSADRPTRRAAATAVSEALAGAREVLAIAYEAVVAQQAAIERLRGAPSWLVTASAGAGLEAEAVEALETAVGNAYGVAQRWWRTKAATLGVDAPEHFDRMAPLPLAEAERAWTLEEAGELIAGALGDVAPELGAIVRQAFDEGWVDATPRPSKRAGAFCAPTVPGAHPFVHASFGGRLDDVLTLAHELGHAVHLHLGAGQGVFHATPPKALEEVASTLSEALVLEALVRDATPRDAAGLLARSLDAAVTDVFRQMSVHRFERAVHERARAGGGLSAAVLDDLWASSQEALHGDAILAAPGYERWWGFLTHVVRTPGYSVGYTIGRLTTMALLSRRSELSEAFGPRLVELFAAGGSDSAAGLLGAFGLDPLDARCWAGGIRAIEDQIDAFAAATAALAPAG